MMEIAKNSKNLDEKQKEDFVNGCDFFMTCKPAFECLNYGDLAVAFRAVGVQCKSVKFAIREFAECDKKLGIINSTCSQTYNPFPDIQEKDIPGLLKEGRKDSCEKVFGDSDCMLMEIKELCGQSDYEKYRKVQMDLANAMRLCGFDETS
ncbi:unnamed protein product [Caenorhabditis brenneri]